MSAQQMTTIIVIVIVNRTGFLCNLCVLLFAFNHSILRSDPWCSPDWQGGPSSESLPQKKSVSVNPKRGCAFYHDPAPTLL